MNQRAHQRAFDKDLPFSRCRLFVELVSFCSPLVSLISISITINNLVLAACIAILIFVCCNLPASNSESFKLNLLCRMGALRDDLMSR